MIREIALSLALACGGCAPDPIQTVSPAAISSPTVVPGGSDSADGVYYFDVVKDSFAHSLAAFKRSHPNLVVTAIAANDYSGYGITVGYFVSTEPRIVCLCETGAKN